MNTAHNDGRELEDASLSTQAENYGGKKTGTATDAAY